jgi:hypothetical protein
MEIYLSNAHADEDDLTTTRGKLGIIFSSKEDLLEMCNFFEKVKSHLMKEDKCHMHLRDSFPNWNKEKHIDIEVNTI